MLTRLPKLLIAALALGGHLMLVGPAAAQDRHAGYYYPLPEGETEIYQARSQTMLEASRASRIGFVTAVSQQNRKLPYPPPAIMFAKGSDAEKLIIVALQDGRIDTLYRARALFADMTASVRTLPVFQELGVQDYFTFFDFLKMLGFKKLTVSNGRDFTHQILIE